MTDDRVDGSGELGGPRLSRRALLRRGGWGALGLAAGGSWAAAALGKPGTQKTVALKRAGAAPGKAGRAAVGTKNFHIAATDGHIMLPGRPPLYIFGFAEAPVGAALEDIVYLKGNVTTPAPTIAVDQLDDVYITVTNLGFQFRPDLDDSHTIHWHGFPNQSALFDGVPEVSIAVPAGRGFPYYYKPRRVGTFMYHCHFEDVEHVQMGMDGNIFVRPSQNAGTATLPAGKYAFNDGNGSTRYNREFVLQLNEMDTRAHDASESIQEFKWSFYDANYYLINGRAYPDTILPNTDPSLPEQPVSSLIQVNPGDKVLLRFSNLGYYQHAMQLPGIPMKVVGEDAAFLRGPGGADLTYSTSTIYIGPGESRDVLVTAPAYDGSKPGDTDGSGDYNRYLLGNRSLAALSNNGLPGLGGMATEVRVYKSSPLPAQTVPNETYL